jgi:hypothetical protein
MDQRGPEGIDGLRVPTGPGASRGLFPCHHFQKKHSGYWLRRGGFATLEPEIPYVLDVDVFRLSAIDMDDLVDWVM